MRRPSTSDAAPGRNKSDLEKPYLGRLQVAAAWALMAREMYVVFLGAELVAARSPLLDVREHERQEVERRLLAAGAFVADGADVLRAAFEEFVPRVDGELEARAVADCGVFVERYGDAVRRLSWSPSIRKHGVIAGTSYERPLRLRLAEVQRVREGASALRRRPVV